MATASDARDVISGVKFSSRSIAIVPSHVAGLRAKLLAWFRKNGRAFPWRETDDPYRVLIAEIMLRRTRADQVRPVYDDFVSTFPDAESLDCADEAEVAETVYPLGLHWRTSAYKKVVKELGAKYEYRVPDSREQLTDLPGVGDYVAGAVLSVAYNKQEWIADTNVARVFKRYFGLSTIKEARRDKQIVELAKQYAHCRQPRNANLAILDFAALVCQARTPQCETCPLKSSCAFVEGKLSEP